MQNAAPRKPEEKIETAWRPKLEFGGQDPWQPNEATLPTGVRYNEEKPRGYIQPANSPGISNVALAMGPKTTGGTYDGGQSQSSCTLDSC